MGGAVPKLLPDYYKTQHVAALRGLVFVARTQVEIPKPLIGMDLSDNIIDRVRGVSIHGLGGVSGCRTPLPKERKCYINSYEPGLRGKQWAADCGLWILLLSPVPRSNRHSIASARGRSSRDSVSR